MRVVVAGATGFVGARLVEALSQRGDEVVVLTRNPEGRAARRLAALPKVRAEGWTAGPGGDWYALVDGADAVVNLAGEPVVGHRWSGAQKRRILESRVLTTRAVVEAIEAAKVRPRVFVNASAIGYYGPREDEELDETARAGADFLADVCDAWEAEARKATKWTRAVQLRIGIVLGEEGGSLAEMVRPFKLGAGGPIGSGRQWVSWIHRDDLVSLVLHALDHEALSGPVNATAPAPVRNAELSREIGRVLHRPSWLPVPEFALRVALGEVAGMLVRGQRVVPRKALESGFRFAHAQLGPALEGILRA
jgi:uncharacterized protein (TIGR01777 family)